MAVGMIDGRIIWPSEDASPERLLQNTYRGMAETEIVRFGVEPLLEIGGQHTGEAFTERQE
jgi:hypothetical protein